MNFNKKTTILKPTDVKRKWLVFDATGKVLGRFASEIAKVLRGKHKPDYTPHVDSGDGVIILNAEKIEVTGNKEANKVYSRYTGWIGGLRQTPYRVMKERKPAFILEKAIKGMVPRTKQGKAQLKRLRVFKGEAHNLEAQQPIQVNV